MRVGVVGLGKLGLPVALCLAEAGHEVWGWDVSAERRHQVAHIKHVPEHEPGVDELLDRVNLGIAAVPEIARWAEVILGRVETLHDPEFEGCTPLTKAPRDFDYTYLREAAGEIAGCGTDALVVIVSTCLPGTFDYQLRLLCTGLRVAYHPLFIAMGSSSSTTANRSSCLSGVTRTTVRTSSRECTRHFTTRGFTGVKCRSLPPN